MINPYDGRPPTQFWRTGVAERTVGEVRPIPAKRFAIVPGTAVATAGSCFAQRLAQMLRMRPDIRFLQTEPDESGQPPFSARYGNIYTVRQLWQLFCEAHAGAPPRAIVWQRPDGRFVDALRPAMFAAGFASPEAVRAERARHLAAVREVFARCEVFVFTLGLTEAWLGADGQTALPVAAGVIADDPQGGAARFHNFGYAEILDDLMAFISALRQHNPAARVILTVSPVPMVATFTDEHVLCANTLSKSVLRAVCAAAVAAWDHVYYFPAYEIVTGPHTAGVYFAANQRSVTHAGVAQVMDVFQASFLPPSGRQTWLDQAYQGSADVVCDDDLIVKSVGF